MKWLLSCCFENVNLFLWPCLFVPFTVFSHICSYKRDVFSPIFFKVQYISIDLCFITLSFEIGPTDFIDSIAAATDASFARIEWQETEKPSQETAEAGSMQVHQKQECREKCHAIWNDNYIVIFIVNTFRFYIGCDLCTNWFHGECVGITEKEAKKMDVYICNDCKRAQEGSSEELYCICRTPYDESQWVLIRTSYLIFR